MFETIFYFIYNLVAIFYLICGSILLIYPKSIEAKVTSFFPLLASWGLGQLRNVLHLIFVGAALLAIGKLINNNALLGYYLATTLSGLEIWLGVKFYYYEERDIPQAILHIVLHALLVSMLICYIMNAFSDDIDTIQAASLSLVKALN